MTGAWYHYDQSSYGTNCTNASAATCSGTEDMVSAVADYRLPAALGRLCGHRELAGGERPGLRLPAGLRVLAGGRHPLELLERGRAGRAPVDPAQIPQPALHSNLKHDGAIRRFRRIAPQTCPAGRSDMKTPLIPAKALGNMVPTNKTPSFPGGGSEATAGPRNTSRPERDAGSEPVRPPQARRTWLLAPAAAAAQVRVELQALVQPDLDRAVGHAGDLGENGGAHGDAPARQARQPGRAMAAGLRTRPGGPTSSSSPAPHT